MRFYFDYLDAEERCVELVFEPESVLLKVKSLNYNSFRVFDYYDTSFRAGLYYDTTCNDETYVNQMSNAQGCKKWKSGSCIEVCQERSVYSSFLKMYQNSDRKIDSFFRKKGA